MENSDELLNNKTVQLCLKFYCGKLLTKLRQLGYTDYELLRKYLLIEKENRKF